MNPFFSIIVPCCNVEKYVRECFDSVAGQSFRDWEIVAGVEESKDATEEIVRARAAADPRIRFFAGPRSGSCSVSRNRGVAMAKGRYVIFLDGDDAIAGGSLRRLAEAIRANPDADIYPCAIRVVDDTGRETELRDNYPRDAPRELSGAEATLLSERFAGTPCPMLQMSVFRREFLADNALECVPGLRRQDSEFSPRALFLAKRVVPLHEPFYIYRLQPASVSSSAKGPGYFHGDWATICRNLLNFHARVSREPGFDRRVSRCWARQWLPRILYFWFHPENTKRIPRERRAETLGAMLSGGTGALDALLAAASPKMKAAGWWVKAFAAHPAARPAAELFFKAYFALAERKRRAR